MNNMFFLLFGISLLCIPIFIICALVNLIRRKSPKKHFIFSGISSLVLIISTIGFGLTMDEVPTTQSINTVSESSAVPTESPTSQPTIIPTVHPTATPVPTKTLTPKPTKSPTSQPTISPTPQPTDSPTPQPTATPTLPPTEKPQLAPLPVEAQEFQTEKTPEPQTITEPTSQPITTSNTQSVVTSSGGNSGTGTGESNFNTYNNPEQQQTSDTYVLNTSRHKIHHPSCASVAKIAPKNYATSNSSIAELEAQGYTTCGNCFK